MTSRRSDFPSDYAAGMQAGRARVMPGRIRAQMDLMAEGGGVLPKPNIKKANPETVMLWDR